MSSFLKIVLILLFALTACGKNIDMLEEPNTNKHNINSISLDTKTFDSHITPVDLRHSMWIYDITQLRSHILETHPHFVVREYERAFGHEKNTDILFAMDAILLETIQNIPNLTDSEIMIELRRTLTKLNDNHSVFFDFNDRLFEKMYPVAFKFFSDGIYLYLSAEDYSKHLNSKLVYINHIPIDTIMEYFLNHFSTQNRYHARSSSGADFTSFIRSHKGLVALGVKSEDDESVIFTLVDNNGSRFDLKLYDLHSSDSLNFTDAQINDYPLFLSKNGNWIEFDDYHGILYIRASTFALASGWPIMQLELNMHLNENANNINTIIFDARYNRGGHAPIGFINLLVDNAPHDSLFVFMNESSLSAALIAAVLLQENNAILIGQPSGQNMYFFIASNDYTIRLKYSGYKFAIASQRANVSHLTYIAEDGILRPNILIEYTIDDWINSRDPLLEYVVTKKR